MAIREQLLSELAVLLVHPSVMDTKAILDQILEISIRNRFPLNDVLQHFTARACLWHKLVQLVALDSHIPVINTQSTQP